MIVRVLAVLTLLCTGAAAVAADQPVLGRSLRVDGAASAADHRVAVSAKQTGAPALSNPTAGGATLTIIANGATSTTQSYALDASGWEALGTKGFRYTGPTGADGDPVKRVQLKRSSSGALMLKIDVRDTVGTQPVTIVPPNPGTDGGAILDVAGGDRYCVVLGGAAGGTVKKNSADHWKIVRATTTAGCPMSSVTTSTTATTTTSTTLGCLPDGVYYQIIYPAPPCCSGGDCLPVGPAACGCGPGCDTYPFPACPANANCYLSGPPQPVYGCMALRLVTGSGTSDFCGCPPPDVTTSCSPPCPCPDGQVCQDDTTTGTCGCVPQ